MKLRITNWWKHALVGSLVGLAGADENNQYVKFDTEAEMLRYIADNDLEEPNETR